MLFGGRYNYSGAEPDDAFDGPSATPPGRTWPEPLPGAIEDERRWSTPRPSDRRPRDGERRAPRHQRRTRAGATGGNGGGAVGGGPKPAARRGEQASARSKGDTVDAPIF